MSDLLADDAQTGMIAARDGAQTPGAYRVLARKYRPRSFDDLIGQEAMVRTLRNAFAANRIHQAYIFTGVRGVGKTTTARIIARALNYALADGSILDPTIDMPVFGQHCEAIIESRHVDVIEMDAASNTGVDNMREIIEAVRYRPAYARYKVYIIDEVHMLSNSSFNALLKTLEEPPEHVKFLFATTEIRKVPVTVLSRCQRFDLKRIDAPLMMSHLKGICAKEAVQIDDEALALIARAGEGSVRDCLSLMDQAIAHGAGSIAADQVRDMLGLADRGRVIDLFEQIMRGDIQSALAELAAQYDSGADPVSIVTDLAEYVHTVTRLKLAPGTANDPSLTEGEKSRGLGFASELSIRVLTRTWQMLTKGLAEVQSHPRPIVAAEMLMVRLAYAADLPTPDEALKMLKDGAFTGSAPVPAGSSAPRGNSAISAPSSGRSALATQQASPQPRVEAPPQAGAPWAKISTLSEIVALARDNKDNLLATEIEMYVRPVRVEDGVLEFSLAPDGNSAIVHRLMRSLLDWTGRRWTVALSNAEGAPSIAEVRKHAEHAEKQKLARHPVVEAVLAAFPGAKIQAVTAIKKEDAVTAYSAADALSQPMIDEDGDVIVSDGAITDDDL
jgi:DNA polymerase III subunit gamma/tau